MTNHSRRDEVDNDNIKEIERKEKLSDGTGKTKNEYMSNGRALACP